MAMNKDMACDVKGEKGWWRLGSMIKSQRENWRIGQACRWMGQYQDDLSCGSRSQNQHVSYIKWMHDKQVYNGRIDGGDRRPEDPTDASYDGNDGCPQ